MTQPTIEHVLEEIRRLPVRCEIQKLDNSPSDEFLRGWALGIAMASKTAKDECSKLSQLVAALTAQAGDGNRLPLDDIKKDAERYRFLRAQHINFGGVLSVVKPTAVGLGCQTYTQRLLDDEIDAAIAAAAKDGAG